MSVRDFHTTFNLIIKIEKMIVLCTFNKKHNIACCTAVDDVTFVVDLSVTVGVDSVKDSVNFVT